ncbi:MAG: hypothetical protein E6K68_07965 [Nitrospirae bacterium]|nr:MAG: hypothetical protein E6K68_07965 [Nitrospirota bacterium]
MRMRMGVGALLSTMLACASVVLVSCQTTPPAPEKLKVVNGMKITMEDTIALPDHTIAASNVGQEPLSYIHGRHEIFPTLEAAKDLSFEVLIGAVQRAMQEPGKPAGSPTTPASPQACRRPCRRSTPS